MDPIEETDKLELEGRVEEAAQSLTSWLESDRAEPWMLPDLLRLEMLLGRPLKVIEVVAKYGHLANEETFDRTCDSLIDGLWEVALLTQLKNLEKEYRKRVGETPTSTHLQKLVQSAQPKAAKMLKGHFSGPLPRWSSMPTLYCEDIDACLKLREQAHAAGRAGEYMRAKELAQQALLLSPFDPYLLLFLASTRYHLDDLDGALKTVDGVLRRYPENFEAHWLKSRLVRKKDGVKAALRHGAEMCKVAPWFILAPVFASAACAPTLKWKELEARIRRFRQARAEARQIGDAAVKAVTERMWLKQDQLKDPAPN